MRERGDRDKERVGERMREIKIEEKSLRRHKLELDTRRRRRRKHM